MHSFPKISFTLSYGFVLPLPKSGREEGNGLHCEWKDLGWRGGKNRKDCSEGRNMVLINNDTVFGLTVLLCGLQRGNESVWD